MNLTSAASRTHSSTPRPSAGRAIRRPAVGVAAVALTIALGLSACSSQEAQTAASPETSHSQAAEHGADGAVSQETALREGMRTLWQEHMEWTYATVAAFAAGNEGLDATIDRLMANQSDIGAAVVPFYGQEAGDALTVLLEAHITGAVPVLTAAKAGNSADLATASDAWYANAREIGDFLASANPAWPAADMEAMMELHIDQTIAYAGAQLQGDYAASIAGYETAVAHMREMADMLTNGIVEQFPEKFAA